MHRYETKQRPNAAFGQRQQDVTDNWLTEESRQGWDLVQLHGDFGYTGLFRKKIDE